MTFLQGTAHRKRVVVYALQALHWFSCSEHQPLPGLQIKAEFLSLFLFGIG
jgi:hypothetical protein